MEVLEQLQEERDNKLHQLESQLREALAAEGFFNQSSGKLITELFVKEITRLTREVTSDKFVKDHAGYVNAVSELRAYQKILKKLQVAASPQRRDKIKERIDEVKENA